LDVQTSRCRPTTLIDPGGGAQMFEDVLVLSMVTGFLGICLLYVRAADRM
jgi:hypothetical protein